MRGGVVRGLVAGLALGLVAAAVASVLMPRVSSDAAATSLPEPVVIERTFGPQPNGLPRLWSDTAPPGPATPQGDE